MIHFLATTGLVNMVPYDSLIPSQQDMIVPMNPA